MSQNLYKASNQWRSRPADQRFVSLFDLNEFAHESHRRSFSKVVSSRTLEARPVEGDNGALVLLGVNGEPANVTHYAFGQLAQRAGAPAGYLRSLPAALAADNINYGLQYAREVEDIGILAYHGDGQLVGSDRLPELRAATGPNYGRIWNETLTQALVDRFGDGVSGDFKVPGEFGKDVVVDKSNTTLYASDRDLFVFLADEKHRITVPNRRNGESGDLARGFFVWNSEVGAASFGIATFLFDYVCCNRIVWGAQQYAEVRIRHTACAQDRWLEEVVPAIENYAESSTVSVVKAIENAKAKRVDDLDKFLASRNFNKSQAVAIQAAFQSDEQRPIENLWDVATGITAYARGIQYQNERVDLERAAGKVLDLA